MYILLTVHRAYDLAQATAYMFAGSYPNFSEVDRIEFTRPVDIGDLVRLRCRVVYTSDDPASSMVKVEVTAQVMRPER
jgi:acyl-coenzyme A thioesterase 9